MAPRSVATVSALAVLAFLLALLPPGPTAHAATFTVSSTADEPDASPGDGRCFSAPSGSCTLRAAIMEANALAGADTITLPAGTYRRAVGGTGEDAAATGDLDITQDLTILGADPRTTTVRGGGDRVFDVHAGAVVSIAGLTVTNGATTADDGGGIRNAGQLSLDRVTIASNSVRPPDESPACNNSQPTRNGRGSGIYNTGTLVVTNSTITQNLAVFGRFLGAPPSGGAIFGGAVILTSTTIDGNQRLCYRDGFFASSDVDGVFVDSLTLQSATLVDPFNATIARAQDSIMRRTCPASLVSLGHNVGRGAECSDRLNGPGDILITDDTALGLGPLQNNGGPTDTRALGRGSVAVDAGSSHCPPTDQRGVRRQDGDADGVAGCDIGAYEVRRVSGA